MTRIIDQQTMYIDNAADVVNDTIKEVRSSVSYTLNSTTEKLTLNGSSDFEIKNINAKEYIVYGYPEKWELDYYQGNNNIIVDGACRLGFNPTSNRKKQK